jgi:hypothetical protein
MVTGSCHCGAVTIEVPQAPEWLGRCNCSFCRRSGTLMAYYPDDGGVRISGETVPYIWGDRMISLHHCPQCGCHTHWEAHSEGVRGTAENEPRVSYGRVGVNARLLDGYSERDGRSFFDGREIEVRPMDNAD